MVFEGKPEEKRPAGRPRRVRIILKLFLDKLDGEVWTGLMWPMIGTSGRLF
jgi:hypothetical protein